MKVLFMGFESFGENCCLFYRLCPFSHTKLYSYGFEELLSHSLTIFSLFLLILNCSEPLDTSPFNKKAPLFFLYSGYGNL